MRIYLIALIMGKYYTTRKYRLMDIDSGEIREVNRSSLIKAINANSWAFKNVSVSKKPNVMNIHSVEQCEIVAKEGMQEIPKVDTSGVLVSNAQFVLTSINLLKNTANLVRYEGKMGEVDIENLFDRWRLVAGMGWGYDDDRYRRIIEEPLTLEELSLLREADTEYESFILMTRAIGVDCSFKYSVSGDGVILNSYTGSSKHVIVPKFVSIIDTEAFHSKGITDVSLTDNLRVIGISAFENNDISEIDIPKTVTRICKYAFHDNNKLFKGSKIKDGKYTEELNREKFRTYSNSIVMSAQSKH